MESIKYSLDHELILPDYVILDSELSCSMDKKLAAESGIDALCQAIESYWSVKSTAKSKKLAEEAIILMVLSIENAVNGSISDREIMVKASNLAGKAINITKTTAAHAISYPMTSIYGIPHGHAVALTLGEFFIVNSNGNSFDYRGQRYLSDTMKHLFSLFRCKDSLDCRSNWLKIMRNLGLETDIRKLGIKSDSDFNLIVDNIDINRLGNNPVKLEREDLVLLLKEGL